MFIQIQNEVLCTAICKSLYNKHNQELMNFICEHSMKYNIVGILAINNVIN